MVRAVAIHFDSLWRRKITSMGINPADARVGPTTGRHDVADDHQIVRPFRHQADYLDEVHR
jgi:hypothetical protein